MIFIINNKIIYDQENHTLKNSDDPSRFFNLTLPVSLCLSLLIKNKGEIVSHNDFIAEVWQSRGMHTNVSTLYQNISLLRKSFRTVGYEENIINTFSKKGFSIIADIEPFETTKEHAEQTQQTQQTQQNANANQPQEYQPETEDTSVQETFSVHLFKSKKTYLFIMTVIFYFIILSLFSYKKTSQFSFKKYTEITTINSLCHIMRNDAHESNDIFFDFLKTNTLSCSSEEWWYITNTPPNKRFSLIQCARPMDDSGQKNGCRSSYYAGFKKNEN